MTLAGCAGTPAPEAVGAAPVAAPMRWQAALPAASSASGPRLDQVISDPELVPLQAAARDASADLGGALARIERARATRVAAGAAERPRLDAVAAAQRARVGPGVPVSTSLNLGVQAGWELDLFGARRAAAAAAGARLHAVTAQRDTLARALDAEVASSLLALRGCVAQRELAASDSLSREETARLTRLREGAGLAAPAEAALARASAAQGRAVWVARRAACEQQLKAMVELTGVDEGALRERGLLAPLPLPRALPVGRAIAVTTLPADLLLQRPDLRAAAATVQAAAADQRGAQAALYPQVSLSGSIGGATTRSAGVGIDGSTWSIGPLQVSWPLFDVGVRRSNVSAARAEYDAAVSAYQTALRRAVREVEQSLVALAATGERETDAASAAEDFDAALRATEQRHRSGLASLFELEDARRSALAAHSALIDLKRERAQAWIDLTRALGGA